MLIPETILYNATTAFLKYLRTDYAARTDKSLTLLHILFDKNDNDEVIKIGKTNYLEQAKEIFLRTDEHRRNVSCNIGYNVTKVETKPLIHIMLPRDSKGSFDSIGLDERNAERGSDDVEDEGYSVLYVEKSRTHNSTYNMMCTSDNSNEVVIMYYMLEAMFTIFSDHFEMSGIHNIKTYGQDLQMYDDYVPPNIFHRNYIVDFQWENFVKYSIDEEMATELGFQICSDIGDHINGQ